MIGPASQAASRIHGTVCATSSSASTRVRAWSITLGSGELCPSDARKSGREPIRAFERGKRRWKRTKPAPFPVIRLLMQSTMDCLLSCLRTAGLSFQAGYQLSQPRVCTARSAWPPSGNLEQICSVAAVSPPDTAWEGAAVPHADQQKSSHGG